MKTPHCPSLLSSLPCLFLAAGLLLPQFKAGGQSVPVTGVDWVFENPVAGTVVTGTPNGTGETLNDVAARVAVAANGVNRPALPGLCIAVGANGEGATAVNGTETWTRHHTGTTNDLNAIVYPGSPSSASTTKPPAPYETFVAVGSHGTVGTTKDGVNWIFSNVGNGTTEDVNLVRLVWNGLMFVALAEGVPAAIYTSPGTETAPGSGVFLWTKRQISSQKVLDLIWSEPSQSGVNTSADVFVALLETGFLTSPDAITWTSVAFPNTLVKPADPFNASLTVDFTPKAITWNNQAKFTVVGTSSSDSVSVLQAPQLNSPWTKKTPSPNYSLDTSRVISYSQPAAAGNGSSDAMIAFDNLSNGQVLIGTNAGVWDNNNTAPGSSGDTLSIAWKGATRVPGGTYIIVGELGRIETTGSGNANAVWANRYSTGTTDSISSGVWTTSMVAVSDAGDLIRSTDGTYWSKVTSPTTSALRDVIYNGSRFLAVGDGGTILTSDTGATWVSRAPNLTTGQTGTTPLKTVVWTGTAFVAAGGTSSGIVFRSTDGINWTQVDPGTNPIKRVVYNGSKLIAMDDSSFTISTNHGATWSGRSPFPDTMLAIFTGHATPYTVEESALVKDILFDGTRIVVVGTKVATGTDVITGSTWTNRTPAGFTGDFSRAVRTGRTNLPDPLKTEVLMLNTNPVDMVTRATDTTNSGTYSLLSTGSAVQLRDAIRVGSRSIIVGDGGTILTKDDAVGTWYPRSSGITANIRAIVSNGQLPTGGGTNAQFLCVGANTISTSPDGDSWSQPSATGIGAPAKLSHVIWTGSKYMASSTGDPGSPGNPGTSGSVLTSANGTDWTAVLSNVLPHFYNIHFTGSLYLAVGESSSTSTSSIYTSTTGNLGDWNSQSVPNSGRLQSIASSPSIIVVGGSGGKFVTSVNGTAWTSVTGASTGDIKDIKWNGSMFVAVTTLGEIETSTNGATWTEQLDTTEVLNTVVWTGAQFVAMGKAGACYTSFNGLNWRDYHINTDRNFNDVIWAGSQLVAFGDQGVIMSSKGLENDQPLLTFGASTTSVLESAGSVTVTVNLQPASLFNQTVNLTASGTATSGVKGDYVRTTTLPVVFAAGETQKTITFNINDDPVDDDNETIILSFSGLTGEAKVGSVPTETITITDNDQVPTFITPPTAQLVPTGGTTAPFSYVAEGTPTMLIKWRKSGKPILNQTSSTLTLSNVTLLDAAAYDIQLTNNIVGGTKDSADAQLGVVDASPKTVVLLSGTNTPVKEFTQLVAGKEAGLFQFTWKKGTTPLDGTTAPDDTTHTGRNTKAYSMKTVQGSDEGVYVCSVTDNYAHTVPGGPVTLFVVSPGQIPVITPGADLSRLVSEPIDYTPVVSNHPTKWTVTGLPPGLKADLTTGRIYGHPTTASKPGTPSKVKFTAINPAGPSVPDEIDITINALPLALPGTYVAKVGPDAEANNDLGGRIELTVTGTGSYTGKAYLAGSTFPFTGAIDTAASGTIHPTTTSVVRKGKTTLPLTFTINTATEGGELTTGSLGAAPIPLGWRYPWTTLIPATDYVNPSPKIYTFGLQLKPADEIPANPNGTGFGNFKVATTGKLSVAFTMADGSTVTQATFVSKTGHILIYAPLNAGTGSIRDELFIATGTNLISGNPVWKKNAQLSTSKDRAYKSGIGPLTLDAVGGLYTPPTGTGIVMGITSVVDLAIDIAEPAPGSPAAIALSLQPTVASLAKVTLPVSNTNGISLTIVPGSGTFNGVFSLSTAAIYSPNPLILRSKVAYKGQIFPDASNTLVGAGYFLLPEMPAVATENIKTTKLNSGHVSLTKP